MLYHYNLKIFPKCRDRLAPHYHIEHLILVKALPVNVSFYRVLVAQQRIYGMYSGGHHARSGLAPVTSEHVALGGQTPLCWHRSAAGWLDILCALKIEVLWVSGTLLPNPTDTVPIREKIFLLNHASFHFLQKIQLRYNLMGLRLCMWPIIGQNVIMWHTIVPTI